MKYKLILFIVLILLVISHNSLGQGGFWGNSHRNTPGQDAFNDDGVDHPRDPCYPGGPDDPIDGGVDSGDDFFFDIFNPFDPNEIISPTGYDSARWVSVNDNMGFTILFENDPIRATAPAHDVYIFYSLSPHQDITTFKLGNFGFNAFVLNVPNNAPFYSTRLDLRDSLGLFVDVTAGIDVVNNRAFWIFQSVDPSTGLSPIDPNLGFLPVKDSTLTEESDTIPANGEGFVTFTLKPLPVSQTRDTVFAAAKIVFDENDTISTNTEFNTIDALPPVSSISASSIVNNTVNLYINKIDDPNASGVRSYDLYVAQDSGNYITYLTNTTDSVISFAGTGGSQYHFFTLATDNTGNREALKSLPDTSITFTSGTPWYADADSDSFGNPGVTQIALIQPAGFVADSSDCNDINAYIHPGAMEICNGLDDNCNGQVDEGDVSPAAAGNITGPSYVCLNQSPFVYTVPAINGANSYKWKLPSGLSPVSGTTTTSGPSISLQTSGSFSGGNINVKGINQCDTGTVSPNFTVYKTISKPLFPAPINSKTGTTYEFCAENNYLLTTTSPRATSFTWTASNWQGATGTLIPNPPLNTQPVTGTALLQLPTGFTSVTIDVTASNCIGTTSARRLIIKSVPGQPPILSAVAGNKIICPLNADYSFSLNGIANGATNYHWTATGDVTPASIINNSTSATFHFNNDFTTGSVHVAGTNLCGEGPVRSLTGLTKLPAAPAAINGPASICKLSNPIGSYSIAAVIGATNYTWTSSAANIKFNDGVQTPANPLTTGLLQVSINFSTVATGNRNITVKSNNSCGSSSPRSKLIANSSCREGENLVAENTVELYPVPASGELNILFYSNTAQKGIIALFDVTGRGLLEKNFEAVEGENWLRLDIRKFSSGVYTLKIEKGEMKVANRVVIY